MEKQLQELDGKLLTLKFTLKKTAEMMTSNNIEAITRHEESIMSKIKAIHALKESIIEQKFTTGESEENITEWSQQIEGNLKAADEEALSVRSLIAKIEKENRALAKVESDKQEMALNRAKHEEKLKQERELLEQQLEYQKAQESSHQAPTIKVASKLPKLSITKFDGLFENWLPFWNKFEAEIDSTTLPAVTKFAYLKELVELKVRADIDGLPLNSEGYERAKSILKGEYGKTSEIINAYVHNILELPVVTSPDPKRVNAFYKTLLYNVQSLETLGKLERVNGMARCVLDKLKGIKADLVRGEAGWQDWDLPRLVIAPKKWRDMNSLGEESINVPKGNSRLYHAEERKPRGLLKLRSCFV